MMAVCSSFLSVALVGGLVWQSTRLKIAPYIVEVDAQGEAKGVGPITDHYQPTDAQIAHHLERFIRHVRSIPIDPVVLRDSWLEAYDFARITRFSTAVHSRRSASSTRLPYSHQNQVGLKLD